MSKYRVQGEYTYTVFKIVEADNEEQAKVIAQDSEPLCTWDIIEELNRWRVQNYVDRVLLD